jgi:hypothetical protein
VCQAGDGSKPGGAPPPGAIHASYGYTRHISMTAHASLAHAGAVKVLRQGEKVAQFLQLYAYRLPPVYSWYIWTEVSLQRDALHWCQPLTEARQAWAPTYVCCHRWPVPSNHDVATFADLVTPTPYPRRPNTSTVAVAMWL